MAECFVSLMRAVYILRPKLEQFQSCRLQLNYDLLCCSCMLLLLNWLLDCSNWSRPVGLLQCILLYFRSFVQFGPEHFEIWLLFEINLSEMLEWVQGWICHDGFAISFHQQQQHHGRWRPAAATPLHHQMCLLYWYARLSMEVSRTCTQRIIWHLFLRQLSRGEEG